MLIFFLIVFTIYFGANTYIFFKGYALMSAGRSARLYSILFIFLASLFIAGRILERNHSGILSDIMNIFGGFWLAYIFYSFLLYLVSDIGLVTGKATGIIPAEAVSIFKKWRFIGVNALTVIIIVAGFINALTPVVKHYEIDVTKPLPGNGEMQIVAVSDIHLGSTIRKRSMKKLQGIIDSLKPDMVLLLGDIIDGEIGPVLRDDLLASFSCPPCGEGIYAITGNHEYIGGIEQTANYISERGIPLLMDETVITPSGITLIGRKDRDSFRYTGRERASLEELTGDIDHTGLVILMDHQPLRLEESVAAGVDIHLSGHTHNGQIWPLSILISRMFEIPYGYDKIGGTNFIVSSGYGLWGPRVRVGSRSEVVLLTLRQANSDQRAS
ncbi:MAG: metallophosphoesterase [Bacteroidales bacterium]